MDRWEYFKLVTTDQVEDDILNKFGAKGWELVTVLKETDVMRKKEYEVAIFKRKYDNYQPKEDN